MARERDRERHAGTTASADAMENELHRQDETAQDQSLAATARAEIAAREEAERLLDEHDRDWKRQRDALGSSPLSEPAFDYGMQPYRSVESEYRQARADWEARQDQITGQYAQSRMEIRTEGHTLERTFSGSGEAAEQEHSPQVAALAPDSEQMVLSRDFSASSSPSVSEQVTEASPAFDAPQAEEPDLTQDFTCQAQTPGRSL